MLPLASGNGVLIGMPPAAVWEKSLGRRSP
jgi:hypothetical protein